MSFFKLLTSSSILLVALSLTRAWGSDISREEQCPGADSWDRSHPDSVGASNANPTGDDAVADAGLLSELKARVETDQALRKKWLDDAANEELAGAVNASDAANLIWLRKLISTQGFPSAAQVGNAGVHLAWILLQHADQDPKLQQKMLPVLEQRHLAGELPANDLARITDRVLLANGEPQKYGTQFDWFAGDFKLPNSTVLAEIDASRSKLGLMPLADYVCTIRKARANARP